MVAEENTALLNERCAELHYLYKINANEICSSILLSLSATSTNILFRLASWSTALRRLRPPPVHIHDASHYSATQGGEVGWWR